MQNPPNHLELKVSEIPGFDSVADLIPCGNFLRFTYVWAVRFERCLNAAYELEPRFTLDLGESCDLDTRPLIRLTMFRPGQCSISSPHQIMGLVVEDSRPRGWDHLRFRVHDYETSDFNVLCSALELSRVAKPQQE
jgi:hypothetical protein